MKGKYGLELEICRWYDFHLRQDLFFREPSVVSFSHYLNRYSQLSHKNHQPYLVFGGPRTEKP